MFHLWNTKIPNIPDTFLITLSWAWIWSFYKDARHHLDEQVHLYNSLPQLPWIPRQVEVQRQEHLHKKTLLSTPFSMLQLFGTLNVLQLKQFHYWNVPTLDMAPCCVLELGCLNRLSRICQAPTRPHASGAAQIAGHIAQTTATLHQLICVLNTSHASHALCPTQAPRWWLPAKIWRRPL